MGILAELAMAPVDADAIAVTLAARALNGADDEELLRVLVDEVGDTFGDSLLAVLVAAVRLAAEPVLAAFEVDALDDPDDPAELLSD